MTNKQTAQVTVDGGYQPNTITFKQGTPAELTFNRVSDAGCLDQVILPNSSDTHDLPLNDPQTFAIDTSSAGDLTFSCGMDMFRGTVVIEP